MKSTILILLCFPFLIQAMSLKEAQLDAKIDISIVGHNGDNHKLIKIIATNHKSNAVTITAAPGFVFNSEDADVQDLILVEPMQLIVKAGNNATLGLKAMCIQAGNKHPRTDNLYTIGKAEDKRLVELSQFIYKNDYQNHMGQDALWAVSDGNSIYGISGLPDEANPIRAFTANLVGVAFDTSLINTNERYISRSVKFYALYLKFYLQQNDDIKLQLFDHKGDYLRDLIVKTNQSKGKYNFEYKLILEGLVNQKYYVRLHVGDEMRNEFVMVIDED